MYQNEYYSQENHGPFALYNIGDLQLEEGGTIPNCQLACAVFGELNAEKDNAVLITTWYSGTSKIMEQVFTGKGRTIDPDKYFIIIVNQIGNGLSTSPHNSEGELAGPNFPHVRIGDDVRAQHKLLTETFGITSLALVMGGSMGAQQTWEWAVRYPEMVKRAAAIAGTAKNTSHDFLYTDTLINAIKDDPGFNNGHYANPQAVSRGLSRHADLWSVMGYSTDFFKHELYRPLGFESMEAFRVGFTQGYFAPMDPNNLLCLAWKWQRGDVSRHTNGDLAAALARVTAKLFVMPIDEDMFFPPRDCEAEQQLTPNSEFRVIQEKAGHLGLFGLQQSFMTQVDQHLADLMALPA